MQILTKENFDEVVRSGKELILFIYQNNQAESVLTQSAIKTIDQMIGKSFEIYLVDSDAEPEILHACSIKDVPEVITVKNTKIFKRSCGVLDSNQILNLLK